MPSSLISQLLLLLQSAPRVLADDRYIKLYHTYSTNDVLELETGPAQRCCSFSCFYNLTTLSIWGEFQTVSWLVRYEEKGCRGNFVKASSPDGRKFMDDHGNDIFTMSSLMVWESGMQPTRGVIDYCQ